MFPSAPRVLYVEDNENDFVLLKYALAQANVPAELVFVSSGTAAIQVLKGGLSPAMILLDLKLPGVSGLDVLAWLRRERADFASPVIMLTSAGSETDEARARDLGITHFAEKPSTLDGYVEFAEQVAGWLKAPVAH